MYNASFNLMTSSHERKDKDTMDSSQPTGMRVALLLFGLLNSFDRIYGQEAASPSIKDVLLEAGIAFDVFFDTSAVEFHKVSSDYTIDETSLRGRTLIYRVNATSVCDLH